MILPAIGLSLLQTIWVVDDNGGPGVNFTDIPPAIAAAADGDVLLVQPGTYTHFTLSGKGLRILGAGASTTKIHLQGANNYRTVISNVPPGSLAFIDRLEFCTAPPWCPTLGAGSRLVVSGSATRAVLADLVVQGAFAVAPLTASQEGAVRVDGAEVQIHRSTLTGGVGWTGFPAPDGCPGLAVVGGGRVHVAASTVTGGNGMGPTVSCFFLSLGNSNGGAGAVVVASPSGVESRLWVADSTVRGGNGGNGLPGSANPPMAGGPGISVASSVVRLSGPSNDLVQGGNAGCSCMLPVPWTGTPGVGILTSGASAVEVHGVAVLGGLFCSSTLTGPATSGPGITLGALPLPVLGLSGTLTLSGSVTFTLSNGPPGAFFLVALDDGPAHFGIPGPFLGEFLIGPPPFTLFLVGALSPAGDFSLTIPLGGLPPSIVYIPFFFQGAVLDLVAGVWRLSNATVAILRP